MYAVYYITKTPCRDYRTGKDAVFQTQEEARSLAIELNQWAKENGAPERYHIKEVEVKPIKNKKDKAHK